MQHLTFQLYSDLKEQSNGVVEVGMGIVLKTSKDFRLGDYLCTRWLDYRVDILKNDALSIFSIIENGTEHVKNFVGKISCLHAMFAGGARI